MKRGHAIRLSPRQFAAIVAGKAKGTRTSGRSVGGHKARRAGDSFESEVILSQSDAAGRVCKLERVPNGGKTIIDRRTGQKEVVRQKSPFDYAGAFAPGSGVPGVGLFFDAKSLSSGSGLAIGNPKIVKPQQKQELAELAAAGAVAGILVRCGPRNDYRWLPGPALLRRERVVRWDDPAWVVLGPIDGRVIRFRVLAEIETKGRANG